MGCFVAHKIKSTMILDLKKLILRFNGCKIPIETIERLALVPCELPHEGSLGWLVLDSHELQPFGDWVLVELRDQQKRSDVLQVPQRDRDDADSEARGGGGEKESVRPDLAWGPPLPDKSCWVFGEIQHQ